MGDHFWYPIDYFMLSISYKVEIVIIPNFRNCLISYIDYNNSMFKKRNLKKDELKLDDIKQGHESEQVSQPKKKVKIQKIQLTNLIGGSTTQKKDQQGQSREQQFESVGFKKGSKIQDTILVGQQAINHQTEQAKKRYLQNIQITKKIKQGKLSTKIYRGANAYANYKLSQSQLQKPLEHYKWKHGPTRNSNNSNSRNTCRFDYDPSLCKDWHDSGYCVFGNSCIYLHDRSNYKTGWELQKDFEKSEQERWKRIINPGLEQEPDYIKDLEKFKPVQLCKYCNSQFKSPVQVSCLHIFCKKCASQIIEKGEKCPECKKRLNGIMNNAEKQIEKKKKTYQQLVKNATKSNQMLKVKRSKFKDTNSLKVFSAQ